MKPEMTTERALTLNHCEGFDDWWAIEWAEHANRAGLLPTGERGSFGWFSSARPSDADIEGTAGEMAAIATAIESGKGAEFYRCAVSPVADGFEIWSPRNSMNPATITRSQAAHLAAEIRRVLSSRRPQEG